MREHIQAEINLALNQKLNEQFEGLEGKLNKRIDDLDKKFKSQETKFDAFKSEYEEHKSAQTSLFDKVDELSKKSDEILQQRSAGSQTLKEEIGRLRINLQTKFEWQSKLISNTATKI